MMPNESFSEVFPTLEDVSYEGEDKVRFIFFDNPTLANKFIPNDYVSLPDDDVTALNVKGNLESGKIDFFKKLKIGPKYKFDKIGNSQYIGMESLLGAIFTDDIEIYTCVMDNIFEKINIVTQIYIERTNKIKQKYNELSDRCSNLLNDPYNLFYLNQIFGASLEFNPGNANTIVNSARNIQQQNKNAQLQSCATLY